jgi:hypothetical protein
MILRAATSQTLPSSVAAANSPGGALHIGEERDGARQAGAVRPRAVRYAHELERCHSLRITARDFATDQAGPHLEVVHGLDHQRIAGGPVISRMPTGSGRDLPVLPPCLFPILFPSRSACGGNDAWAS